MYLTILQTGKFIRIFSAPRHAAGVTYDVTGQCSTFRIVICKGDYRRGLDWCLDLLTTYTLRTRDYTLQITDTQRIVSSAYYILH
jgi:hypothetical protein